MMLKRSNKQAKITVLKVVSKKTSIKRHPMIAVDSNVQYDETTDPRGSQHKSYEISDLSLFNNTGRTEIKQSEPNIIYNSNEKSGESKPWLYMIWLQRMVILKQVQV
jgi:hypothetical protein